MLRLKELKGLAMLLRKYCLQIVVFVLIHASYLPAHDVSSRNSIEQILPLRKRAKIQNDWLKWRLDNILPKLMRDAGIDLWLIVNREYNEDPVYFTLSPQPTIYSYRTTILMLHDKGNRTGVERLSASDHGKGEWYKGAFADRSKKQFDNLTEVKKEIDPKKIGINSSETWHLADGLNATMKNRLERALGPEMSKRLDSAEKLCVNWLQVRSPQEMLQIGRAQG